MSDPDALTISTKQSPALIYISSGYLNGTTFIVRADLEAPMVTGDAGIRQTKRERRILRALLMHALELLDEAEKNDE